MATVDVAAYCCDRDWFLRRTLNYTYELIERTPEQRFVMRTGAGAVPDDNGLRVG
jgi:hypothetical protein